GIRKVEPLARALAGFGAWITGLRRGQSITRTGVTENEWDEANGLWKFNPLADWSSDEIWRYVKDKRVPYNPLYDQGFASIGCAPCSRAIAPGEDERAGRWWWETPESRECGLHVADDRLVRTTASRS
ncbi:MAG: phosphoadenylyl-sulfate reductase, partial [Alphaproteobacteria bacterium]